MLSKNSTISTTGEEDYSVGVLPTDSTTQWSPSLYSQLFGATFDIKISPLTEELRSKRVIVRPAIANQGTSGSRLEDSFFAYIAHKDITAPARDVLRSLTNQRIVAEAEYILSLIQSELFKVKPLKILPPVRAFIGEDGSLLIEWIFKDYRIGFNLESEEKDWGWYLVSKPLSGGIVASGYLAGVDLRGLVAWLVNFVTSKLVS